MSSIVTKNPLRGIVYLKDLLVWNSYDATHAHIISEFGIKPDEQICLFITPSGVMPEEADEEWQTMPFKEGHGIRVYWDSFPMKFKKSSDPKWLETYESFEKLLNYVVSNLKENSNNQDWFWKNPSKSQVLSLAKRFPLRGTVYGKDAATRSPWTFPSAASTYICPMRRFRPACRGGNAHSKKSATRLSNGLLPPSLAESANKGTIIRHRIE